MRGILGSSSFLNLTGRIQPNQRESLPVNNTHCDCENLIRQGGYESASPFLDMR